MLRIRTGLFFSFLFLISSSLHATTYYVATTGSDTNAGTITAPFRTINQAQTPATAGDTIYVRGGIYNERFIIWESGSSSARLTIAAYPGEHVVINGTGTAARRRGLGSCTC